MSYCRQRSFEQHYRYQQNIDNREKGLAVWHCLRELKYEVPIYWHAVSTCQLPRTMALVLIHDLLFTKRGIQSSDGPLKQAVMRHKARLKAELVKYKIKMGAKTDDDLVSQKVKDAGTWFFKEWDWDDNLLIKWSSFNTALCSGQWTQDHGRQSDTSIHQGGVYTGRGSRRSLFVKVKMTEERR